MIADYTPIAPYKPLPWQVEPWRDTSLILLLTGGGGGGKSRLAGEKMHGLMQRYPGAMGLMIRKTRESMTNSTVLFMKTAVISNDPQVVHKEQKHRFEYTNGSMLAYGGMANEEQREQIRSIGQKGGLDFVWVEEANRLSESDFNELLGRMRGSAAPFRQLILTTNPDAPTHWINKRLIIGKQATVYYSKAMNNPHNPADYIQTLGLLTGVQKLRIVDGQWVQAEGIVIDNFDPEVHVTEEAEYNPDGGAIIWGADDGYAYGSGPGTESYHPRVILLGQKTPMGGLNIFAEYVKALVPRHEDSIKEVMEWNYRQPEIAYVDSAAAMFRAVFSTLGIMNMASTHNVEEGVKNVQRMFADGQGVRLLHIHPRCKHLIQELQSYRRDPVTNKILKVDDHTIDALRYMAYHLRYGL